MLHYNMISQSLFCAIGFFTERALNKDFGSNSLRLLRMGCKSMSFQTFFTYINVWTVWTDKFGFVFKHWRETSVIVTIMFDQHGWVSEIKDLSRNGQSTPQNCIFGKHVIGGMGGGGQGEYREDTVSPLNSYFCWKWAFWASNRKNIIMNYELLLSSIFSSFHWQNTILIFLKKHIVTSALKSCIISFLSKKNWNYFRFFFQSK
jgi:hypothetical protein